MKTKIILLFALALATLSSRAQKITNEECGYDAMHTHLMQTDSVYRKQFLERELAIKAIILNQASSRMQTSVYTIPVVVHVKHSGEPIGQGTNYSDATILAGLNDLNGRFRNANGLGVDCEINFCLAVRDSNGNPTSGIERSIGNMAQWPAPDYFNYFIDPAISGLGGGFSIWVPSPMSFTTAAHETGHAFGLAHTSGDLASGGAGYYNPESSCIDQGDRVCDTWPDMHNQATPCPNAGNYMAHATLNKFTQGQKDRMRAGILWYSLLYNVGSFSSSLGCVPVTAVDAAIEEFVYPIKTTYTTKCNSPYLIAPVVKLQNLGTNALTSVIIKYKLDNNALNTFLWNGSLPRNASITITLPSIPITQGIHTILAYSSNPNGTVDGYMNNDSANVVNFTYKTISAPISLSTNVTNPSCAGSNSSATVTPAAISQVNIIEDFEGATDWTLGNGTQINKWYVGTAVANGGSKSIYISNNNNSNLYTPSSSSEVYLYKDFIFPAGATNITVKFDWRANGESLQDYLRVYWVPTSCTPVPGHAVPFPYHLQRIGSLYYNLQNSFSTAVIPGLTGAGLTKRLVFRWSNNSTLGTQIPDPQNPAAIDNIIVSYNIPGTAPYSYLWNTLPVQTTATATNLSNGTYMVTVTDANTCTKTATVTTTQPAAILISTSQANVSCNGGNNGRAAAAASGGTGALRYSWNTIPIQTTAAAVNLSAGAYVVTVTDANSCTKTATVTITQPNPSPLYITAVYGNTRTFNGETFNQRAVVFLCDGNLSGQVLTLKAYLSENNILDGLDVLSDTRTFSAPVPLDTAVVNYWCSVPSNWPSAQQIFVILTIENATGTVLTSRAHPTGLDDCFYDVNGDGIQELADILLVLDAYSSASDPSELQWNASADLDTSYVVELGDLLIIQAAYSGHAPYYCADNTPLRMANQDFSMDIYPNPVTDKKVNLTFEGLGTPGDMVIAIYNMMGMKVYTTQKHFTPGNIITLSLDDNFTRGVYLVTVFDGMNGIQKRLLFYE